jgi:hypothetical protein
MYVIKRIEKNIPGQRMVMFVAARDDKNIYWTFDVDYAMDWKRKKDAIRFKARLGLGGNVVRKP